MLDPAIDRSHMGFDSNRLDLLVEDDVVVAAGSSHASCPS
jgi:hypothetical protein